MLVVDDRPENLLAMEAALEPLGVVVFRAASPEEALRLVEAREFAVILLDVMMPGMDGYEVARRIKRMERPHLTPIIFVTALDQDRRHVHAGYASGAVDYLFKPLDPDVLRNKVSAFVRLHGDREAEVRRERRRYADLTGAAVEARATQILESIADAFYAVDADFRFTYVNRKAEELWGRPRASLLGRIYWSEFPQALNSESHRQHMQVMRERQPAHFEVVSPILHRWLEVSIYPEAEGGLSCYFRDISDRKHAEAERERLLLEAQAARAEAEEASRAKSQFLANMSHELRTPLNAIAGHIALVLDGIHGPVTDAQQDALGRVQRAQRHLLGLINDVLNYARLESGRLEYDLRIVHVRDVLEGVLPMVEPQARARGLALAARMPEDGGGEPILVWADPEKLGQILLNLLSNAVKFTEPGGRILVTLEPGASEGADRACIHVADTGIGIPAEKLQAVFEPFVQVRSDFARVAEGTGLGLAISRDLARGMGGNLTVSSVSGEGSTFTVILRRIEDAEGRAVDRRSPQERRVEPERRSGVDRREETSSRDDG